MPTNPRQPRNLHYCSNIVWNQHRRDLICELSDDVQPAWIWESIVCRMWSECVAKVLFANCNNESEWYWNTTCVWIYTSTVVKYHLSEGVYTPSLSSYYIPLHVQYIPLACILSGIAPDWYHPQRIDGNTRMVLFSPQVLVVIHWFVYLINEYRWTLFLVGRVVVIYRRSDFDFWKFQYWSSCSYPTVQSLGFTSISWSFLQVTSFGYHTVLTTF